MLSPFECLCGNFILPEPASYVFFYAIFNLRKLFYLIITRDRGIFIMEHYMANEKIEAYLKALESEERAAATIEKYRCAC